MSPEEDAPDGIEGLTHALVGSGATRQLLIEPLRVLDDAEQRLLLGDGGEEAEHGQADEEPVRSGAGGQPEGGAERVALGWRQLIGRWSICRQS